MKCQILFSGKNKINISKCRLLKILPRVLSVERNEYTFREGNTDNKIFASLMKKGLQREEKYSEREPNLSF